MNPKYPHPEQVGINNPCTTPDRRPGTCQFVVACPSLLDLIQRNPLSARDREFLRNSQCDVLDGQYAVCCTDAALTVRSPNDNVGGGGGLVPLPDPGICGSSTQNRIIGGKETGLDEFPWMALMEFTKREYL